jgi:hypothetical protein
VRGGEAAEKGRGGIRGRLGHGPRRLLPRQGVIQAQRCSASLLGACLLATCCKLAQQMSVKHGGLRCNSFTQALSLNAATYFFPFPVLLLRPSVS